jgi:hypothetical protein
MTPLESKSKGSFASIAELNVELFNYRATVASNREEFLIKHPDFVKVFSAADENFGELFEVLGTMKDAERKSYVSLIPWVALLQRQCRVAFEAFAAFQSYQGWLLLRPGIEALLIMGKWVDDPVYVRIWEKRQEDREAYRNAYSGKKLRSKSLPHSERLQQVLTRVNDDLVHANPEYYKRHLSVSPGDRGYVNFRIEYFDEGGVHEAHMLAFLHLLLLGQQSFAGLLSKVFVKPMTLKTEPSIFGLEFGERLKRVSASAEAAQILKEFGCVDLL